MTPFLFSLALALTVGVGCAKRATEEIDFGVFQNGVYRNEFFGFTIRPPEAWCVQDQEQQRQMVDAGLELVSPDGKSAKRLAKAAEMQTVNLFMFSKYPIGAPGHFNPSLFGLAERIRHAPGIQQGRDYLVISRNTLKDSQMNVSFTGRAFGQTSGDVMFDVMPIELQLAGVTLQQRHFAVVTNGYALLFVQSFTSEEEEAALDGILETLEFQ